MFLFDEVADDFVVEILNRLPSDSLFEILFLFRFKSKSNKKLLKFFVAEVYAKLLETAVKKRN